MAELIQPYAARASISEDTEGLRISIPAKRSWTILFLAAWIAVWTFAGISAGTSLRQHFSLFLVAWMLGWTGGEIAVAYTILYAIGGREVILAKAETLTIRTEIFGLGWAKSYPVHELRDLRFQPESGAGRGHRPSKIAVDYQARTVTFAPAVDEEEAAELISRIGQRAAIPSTAAPEETGGKFWRG